ncbi:unnamed protein product [Adineta ricciae]|uniref:Uncharacterized protein n=1 Tax=Adineta ricciae TaxID=249248 RepID=A0A814QN45_ADIRI|nr:unnamed protein product [Adineta ricciae]
MTLGLSFNYIDVNIPASIGLHSVVEKMFALNPYSPFTFLYCITVYNLSVIHSSILNGKQINDDPNAIIRD